MEEIPAPPPPILVTDTDNVTIDPKQHYSAIPSPTDSPPIKPHTVIRPSNGTPEGTVSESTPLPEIHEIEPEIVEAAVLAKTSEKREQRSRIRSGQYHAVDASNSREKVPTFLSPNSQGMNFPGKFC